MQHIETVVLGSAAASITFSAIPQTYTDLLLVFSLRNSGEDERQFTLYLNGVTTNFTQRELAGTGSRVVSDARTDSLIRGAATPSNSTSNTFGNGEVYFPNYRSSTSKSYSVNTVGENNGTASLQYITAGLWSNNSAITQIQLASPSSFAQYASASLFGITAGSSGGVVVS